MEEEKVKIPTYIRGAGKIKADYTYTDMYESYIKSIKDSYMPLGTAFEDTDYALSCKEHNKILKDFHKLVFKKIVETNYIYKLPLRLGNHSVKKYKEEFYFDNEGNVIQKYLAVDYVATKLLWEKDPEAKEKRIKVFNLNEHTDGYRHRFFWEKKVNNMPSNVKGILAYNFSLCRDNKRYLSKTIKNNTTDYYLMKAGISKASAKLNLTLNHIRKNNA